MQTLFEIILYKKPEITETPFEVFSFMSNAAAISVTILNFANNAGIKWLAILAIIDLAYFVSMKVCLFGFLLIYDYAHYGTKYVREEVFEHHYNFRESTNEITEDFVNEFIK